MPEYCYKTHSGTCEGTNCSEKFSNCTGKFTIKKPMSESSRPEKCKLCLVNLKKDLQSQGAFRDILIGPDFYRNSK